MITKITKGSRPGDIAAYLHGPGRRGEHEHEGIEGGTVIAGTLGREGERDGAGWARDMREAMATRPEVKNPVWHMSLRNHEDDRTLTDREWGEIAGQMGEVMGWGDRPWVAVRHGDDHIHIVVSRVGHDGGPVWDAGNDRYNARTAAVAIEQEWGLTPTPVRSSERTQRREDHQVTQGEYRRAERTGQAPERVLLAERVRAARDGAQGQGREGFEAALSSVGVEYRANVAATGRMNGYSFHLLGHRDGEGKDVWMSASKVDRSLSWSKMREGLETARPLPAVEVDRGRFESAAKHTARTQQARAVEGQRQASERMGQVPVRVAARDVETSMWWAGRHGQDQARQGEQAERARLIETMRIVRQAFPTAPVTGPKQTREVGAAERVRRANQNSRETERGGYER